MFWGYNRRQTFNSDERRCHDIVWYTRQEQAECQRGVAATQAPKGASKPLGRKADRQLGIFLVQRPQALDEWRRRHHRVDSQSQFRFKASPGPLGDGLEPCGTGQNQPRLAHEHATDIGELGAMSASIKQGDTLKVFKCRHHLADRRLRAVELPPGRGKAARVGNRYQHTQLV